MTKVIDLSRSPHAAMQGADIENVSVSSAFWRPKLDINRTVSIPHQKREIDRTGRLHNFAVIAGKEAGQVTSHLAPDSDVYKWLEGIAFALAERKDPELEQMADEAIALITAAQDEDGYLDTSFMHADAQNGRWENLDHGHELYCGGHLIQAAVAHHRATGKDTLFSVACKWADLVCERFGPGKTDGTGGHEEVEMALVELYRETGERKYLNQAQYFIDARGRGLLKGDANLQDHAPVREQDEVTGHAVRQLYLASGIADLYAETGEDALLEAQVKLWENFTSRRMYITGGAGARWNGEAFGADYELPDRSAYAETCAAIASFMWNWRLLLVTGEARYADLMEQALYNGLLSGGALEGTTYFYVNPLEHDGRPGTHRNHRGINARTSMHWDHVPCCPPNMARLLASLPGCIYSCRDADIRVHHFIESEARLTAAGTAVVLKQTTTYPWGEAVTIDVNPEQAVSFSLKIRIPGWCASAVVVVNGEALPGRAVPGSYVNLERAWQHGDRVELSLPMPVRRVKAHAQLTDHAGKIALMRGPLVYCVEGTDHPGADIFCLVLPHTADLTPEFVPALLGGVTVIRGRALVKNPGRALYYTSGGNLYGDDEVELTAVPYFAWANRKPGPMRVWIEALEL